MAAMGVRRLLRPARARVHRLAAARLTDWAAKGRQWAAWDPNAETREEVLGLVEQGDSAGLEARLGSRLTFGTAGIRGPMGAGSACMNELTVIQTTQGLLRYLEHELGESSGEEGALRSRGVCLGYDHRRRGSLHSERFALLAAAVFVSQGVPVYLYSRPVPTPLVPWGLEQEGCAAGVMVTASHNPKEDNGYKVYWRSGHQITPPHDSGIAGCIDDALEPWALYDADAVRGHELCIDRTEALEASYFSALGERLCTQRADNGTAPPAVYTAMHGVGASFASRALESFGLPDYIPVAAQCEPDPDFPTVAFPNPEEPEVSYTPPSDPA